jgi:hypothetical protein
MTVSKNSKRQASVQRGRVLKMHHRLNGIVLRNCPAIDLILFNQVLVLLEQAQILQAMDHLACLWLLQGDLAARSSFPIVMQPRKSPRRQATHQRVLGCPSPMVEASVHATSRTHRQLRSFNTSKANIERLLLPRTPIAPLNHLHGGLLLDRTPLNSLPSHQQSLVVRVKLLHLNSIRTKAEWS